MAWLEWMNQVKFSTENDSQFLFLSILIGLAGVVWFCFWAVLAYERPSVHPTISADERTLIETRQGEAALIYEVCRI